MKRRTARKATRNSWRSGGSVSLTYRIKNFFRLGANYTFRPIFHIADPGTFAEVLEEGFNSWVPWEPHHQANLNFYYLPENGLRIGMGLHAASERKGSVYTDRALPEEDRIRLQGKAFLSGFAAWRFLLGSRWIEMGVRAYNLTKIPFEDINEAADVITRRMFLYFRGTI